MKHLFFFLCCVAAIQVHAQSLVFNNFDLDPGSQSSFADNMTTCYDKMYFTAHGPDGLELYITDGTPAGTYHIDLNPGPASSDPQDFTLMNGKVYFSADDGVHGQELWETDGTQAGTHMLLDLFPGKFGSDPSELYVYKGKLFFSATDGSAGFEPWISDGTAAGTVIFKDINTTAGSEPSDFTELNGQLCFRAMDNTHGQELWITDGTSAGTKMLKDIYPGASGSSQLLAKPLSIFIQYGNELLFGATDGAHGFELWKTDGTNAGTVMVKDINPGTGDGFSATGWIEFSGRVYFLGISPAEGGELWATDGTDAGTQMLKDIYPGSLSGHPRYFTKMGNRIYFSAKDAAHGDELWASDGTAGGTMMVYDAVPGTVSGRPERNITYKNHVYFAGDDGTGLWSLWISDGTGAGTKLIAPPNATNTTSPLQNYINFHVFDTTLFITANFDTTGFELWSIYDREPDAVPQVHAAEGIYIYPNPAHDNITIALQRSYNTANATVYDIYGRLVWQQTIAGNTAAIPLQQLPRGQYIIDLLLDGQHYRQKVVAE